MSTGADSTGGGGAAGGAEADAAAAPADDMAPEPIVRLWWRGMNRETAESFEKLGGSAAGNDDEEGGSGGGGGGGGAGEDASTAAAMEARVAEVLGISAAQARSDLYSSLMVDVFFYTTWFARTELKPAPNSKQFSALWALTRLLVDNIREHNMGLEENFRFFQRTLAAYGCGSDGKAPEWPEDDETAAVLEAEDDSEELAACNAFEPEQAVAIASFFQRTFFQHYRLYVAMLKPGLFPRPEVTSAVELELELPPTTAFPPMREFQTLESWEAAEAEARAERERVEREEQERRDAEAAARQAEEDAREKLTPERIREITAKTIQKFLGQLEAEIRAKAGSQEAELSTRLEKLEKIAGVAE